jgi:RimJ/RimL family protein N-acetyltransferase
MCASAEIILREPWQFFGHLDAYCLWIEQNEASHLMGLVHPSSALVQEFISLTLSDRLVGFIGFSEVKSLSGDYASISFHVNSIVTDKEHRGGAASGMLIDAFLQYAQRRCDDLMFEGAVKVFPDVVCTPTTLRAVRLCDTIQDKFLQQVAC